MTSTSTPESLRVLFLPATPRDAATMKAMLDGALIEWNVCGTLGELCKELRAGAGAVVIAAEQLLSNDRRELESIIRAQPTWSDIPLIVVTRPTEQGTEARVLGDLGNVTFLERPISRPTLLSSLRSALRARHRQYETARAITNRDQFLAMLGHEIRNPLSAIGLALNLWKGPERPAPIQIIERQTRSLVRIVDELLEVSRISRGNISIQRESIELGELVRSAVDAYAGSARERRLELSLSIADAPLFVSGDAVRLEQVVANLLGNAVKFTPEGSIAVHVYREGKEAVISVRDSGIGIPLDMQASVFELFTQAHPEISRRRGGLGLGLSLARSLVKMHQGSIEARSEGPGMGSEFVVRLPSVPEPTAVDERRSAAPAATRPLRILIVEDVDDIREPLVSVLRAQGHTVAGASTAGEGLARASAEPFDVAFIDIGLPDYDGYELARRIHDRAPTTRLVALTGFGQTQDRERARSAGFDLHLTKPVALDALQAHLDELS